MEFLQGIWAWYAEAPYTHGLLTFTVLNIVVQKTPWKGDDDALKMAKDIFLSILGKKS